MFKTKCSSVLVPIVFFIFFDCIALSLNFWLSYSLSENAVAINLSGRQRMLSQRMTKALFYLNSNSDFSSDSTQLAFLEFKNAVLLFDQTLNSLWQGGETLGGDQKPIKIKAVVDENARINIAQGLQLWSQVYLQLQPLVDSASITPLLYQAAKANLEQNNIMLLKLMNELTLSLELNSVKEAQNLRLLQSLVLVLALINFLLICKRLLSGIKFSQRNIHSLNPYLKVLCY